MVSRISTAILTARAVWSSNWIGALNRIITPSPA